MGHTGGAKLKLCCKYRAAQGSSGFGATVSARWATSLDYEEPWRFIWHALQRFDPIRQYIPVHVETYPMDPLSRF